MQDDKTRRFVPPFGKLTKLTAVTVNTANKAPLIGLNRYPGQAIGFAIRLPDGIELSGRVRHYALSIRWAEPARWWKK